MASTELVPSPRLPKPQREEADWIRNGLPTVLSALGGAADPTMFASSVIMAVNDLQLPANAVINKASLAKAVLGAAYLQLPFGNQLGFAYLLPFRNKGTGQHDITLCVGYQGFLELGFRGDFLSDVHVDVALQGEEWEYFKDETGPRLRHVPDEERFPSRSNIRSAYCIYHTVKGGRGIKVVPLSEIKKVDKERDVWNSNYPGMCLKTAVRRASKEWRKTPHLAYAVRADEQSERDEPPDLPPVNTAVDDLLKTDEPKWSVPTGEETPD